MFYKWVFSKRKLAKLCGAHSTQYIANVMGASRFQVARWRKGYGEPPGSCALALLHWQAERSGSQSMNLGLLYNKRRRPDHD